jgi:hypothetical protein
MVRNINHLDLNFKTRIFDFDGEGDVLQSFRWIKLEELIEDDFTFPIDKHVAGLLIKNL